MRARQYRNRMSSSTASPLRLALPDGGGRRVLVTGASGYIGGRVIPELLAAGFTVRATARSVERLRGRSWFGQVETAEADLQSPEQVRAAMQDVHTVLYLVHSMGAGTDFLDREEQIARTVARAAETSGVHQIVYLGGLHPPELAPDDLSDHMRSRDQVARILLEAPVPALVLRAGVIIGSGSVSFEMIRHLAEVLPVMPGPRWLTNWVEPIAIRDVLYYLARASALDAPVNDDVGIGNGHPQQFRQLLTDYADVAGLGRRWVYALPVPAPRLSGFWIGLTTPIPRGIAMPLAASMAEDAVTTEHRIADLIPDPPGGFTSYREACRRAIRRQLTGRVETTWDHDVHAGAEPAEPLPSDPEWSGHTVLTDVRERDSAVPAHRVWQVIAAIGGPSGWYSPALLWRIRGWLDKAAGGYGLTRGRSAPDSVQEGDHIDWWRVESVKPGQELTLRAEMRAAGRAWLQLSVAPRPGGGCRYRQRAVYFPRGLLGRAYWAAVLPFHALIFPAMARNILRAAKRADYHPSWATAETG